MTIGYNAKDFLINLLLWNKWINKCLRLIKNLKLYKGNEVRNLEMEGNQLLWKEHAQFLQWSHKILIWRMMNQDVVLFQEHKIHITSVSIQLHIYLLML
jgi:hypothetical protein